MNEYGLRAMNHWKTWLPDRYDQIDDPATFFEMLGNQMAAQIGQISEQLEIEHAGQLAQLGYLDRVGLMNNLRLQAQELVFAGAMPAPPEAPEEQSLDPVDQLMRQWMDEDEMPLSHDHRLWTMLEDDQVSVTEFMAANRAWLAELRQKARTQLEHGQAQASRPSTGTD